MAGLHARDRGPRDPRRARRGRPCARGAGSRRCAAPVGARGVRPSRRRGAFRRPRRGRLHATPPLRARHRRGVARQRRSGARAVRVAVPIDRGRRRRPRVQLGLERGGDGPDVLALHRDHARRARRDRGVEPGRDRGPRDGAAGVHLGERLRDRGRGGAWDADAGDGGRRRGALAGSGLDRRPPRDPSTPTSRPPWWTVRSSTAPEGAARRSSSRKRVRSSRCLG